MTIPAHSIRGRSPLLLACLALVIIGVVSSALAYAWRQPAAQAQQGHDLGVYGPQVSGIIGFKEVRVGTTYRFAFPVPRNKSTHPIKLTGAAVQTIPRGAQVVGYPIYSLKEVGNYLLNFDDSVSETQTPLLHKKDYSAEGVTIPPRSDSDYFVMVAVKVVEPVTQVLSGCRFDYMIGSHKFYQTFPCQFQLGDTGGG
jgi:hypothetical protein